MAIWQKKILGLTIEERSIKVAEVRCRGDQTEAARLAEFVFSPDLSWDDPLPLGAAFAGFLRDNHFTAGNAIIGVPARWLVSREKIFPSVDSVSLVGMVRLEAEQSFAIAPEQLLFDYAETNFDNDHGERRMAAKDKDKRRVFIVAIHRRKSDQVMTMLAKAGLQARALTPSVLPAAVTVEPERENGLFFFIKPDYVEVVLRERGVARMLRHLPGRPVSREDNSLQKAGVSQLDLVNEAKKIMVNYSPRHEGVGIPLFLCNETTIGNDKLLRQFEGRLSVPVKIVGESDNLQTAVVSSMPGDEGTTIDQKLFTTTVVLAKAGVKGCDFFIDFLHSRLREVQKGMSSRTWARGAAVLGVPLLIAVFMMVSWYAGNRRLTALRSQAAVIAPQKKQAEQFWQRYEVYLAWTERRPLFLEPLREVALAIPREERIWITSLTVREDMQMVLVGKADNEQTILETLDRLRQAERLRQVKTLYLRESGNETTFSISLTFIQ